MRFITLFVFACFLSLFCRAQYVLTGSVCDTARQAIPNAQIVLTLNDSLCGMSLTNEKGIFRIKNVKAGKYELHAQAIDFQPYADICTVEKDVQVSIRLLPMDHILLDSLVVTADPSQNIRRTATGSVYHLSEQAKNSGDPYQALGEIPELITNPGLKTLTMTDGTSPLILIDGIRVNSGINPINPKDIESVEVVNVVSARYLKDGVKNIVNIKLKEKANPFVYLEAMTRHNIPLYIGMGGLYFEVGNPKISLYGRVGGQYYHHEDTEGYLWQQNTGYDKTLSYSDRSNAHRWDGELLLKARPSKRDYLALYGYGYKNTYKTNGNGNGILESGNESPFDYDTHRDGESYIWTGTLFHLHKFSKGILETMLAYNKNKNNMNGEQTETYPDWTYYDLYRFENKRESGSLNIDYYYDFGSNSLSAGSYTKYINDHLNKVSEDEPIFHHREWNQYLYASFSSRVKKLSYMLSVGAEGIWLKAGPVSHHYFKPRGSASATYSFNDRNSLRVGYTLTNTAPDVSTLNPYNTSTDSLVITQGNPYLKPMQKHTVTASYTFNKKGFYFTPAFYYDINKDMIEEYGYTEDGIYTATYRNHGSWRAMTLRGNLSYNFKWGRVYGFAGYASDLFEGQSRRHSFLCGAGGYARYKKFTLNVQYNFTNKVYSPVSVIRYRKPQYSIVQLTYNFTDNFYISAALEHIAGHLKKETTTYRGSYHAFSSITELDKGLRPWILIRYTFRKNVKRKIPLNNFIQSKEKGISLIKEQE